MNQELHPTREISIAELEAFGCPLSAINTLESMGKYTVHDLLQMTPKELRGAFGIGKRRCELTINSVKLHQRLYKW